MKILKIKDPIYKTPLVILIGDPRSVEKYIYRKYKYKITVEKTGYAMAVFSITLEDGDCINYLWMPEWKFEHEYIVMLGHEILHVVCYVFDRIGIQIENDNSEPAAYYFETLFDTVLEKLND